MRLICYLSNGYPSIEASVRLAQEYVEAGCDIIEVDFPAVNPYLESEYIAGRMKAALEKCDDYGEYMDGIKQMKNNHPDTKFIIIAYEDTILSIGLERFVAFCLENDICDIIYVGGTNEQAKNRLVESGIKISCYVQFHMPEEEIDAAQNSNGFVYMQAKPTNGNVNVQYPALKDCIDELRRRGIAQEIYAGVGIHTIEDLQLARESGADAVFVGSSILKLQEDVPRMKAVIAEFKKACNE